MAKPRKVSAMTTQAPSKPTPPKTPKAPAESSKRSLTDARPAMWPSGEEGKPDARWIIGRSTVGNATGLSAFRLRDGYNPDLTKIPESGNVTLTLDANNYVVGIGITASL